MVEVLGTLAIMGILGLAGMWAYNAGMDQLKTNTLINEAQKRAVIVAGQINMLNRTDPSLGEFSDNTFGGGTFGTNVTVNGLYQQFGIQVSNVPKRVCQNILNAVGDSIAIRRLAPTTSPTESLTTCEENNDFLMIYNNDLSSSGNDITYTSEWCNCQTVCGQCIVENETPRCVNECPANVGGQCSATQPCSGDCVGCVIPEGETTGTCQACQPVEYLESTGTQYINTNITPNQNYAMKLDFKPTTFQAKIFAGTRKGSATVDAFTINCGGTTQQFGAFGNSGNVVLGTCDTNRHVAYISKNRMSYDAASFQQNFSNFQSATSIYLFGCNYQNTLSLSSEVSIYGCKIWNGSTLVGDFVPVLDPQNAPAMFDRVTKSLFYNAGTGDFSYGN